MSESFRHRANGEAFSLDIPFYRTACPALCNALDPESIRETVRHLTGGGTAHIGIILSNILP